MRVKDYLCLDCQESLTQFGSIFDTGNVGLYVNIKFINEFFEEQEDQPTPIDRKIATTIYENYKPRNSQEMREYMLFVMDKSLRKLRKQHP